MNSIKKNNSGLTLIELLITIVIIGIVAVPFLTTFIQTINVNVSARRLQNATIAGQDLAEEFKSKSLDKLLNEYTYSTVTDASKLDIYKFKGIEFEGANGEEFYIDVELDPNIVYDASGTCVNGVSLPLFSSLYGGNTIMIFKQYTEPDTTVNRATSVKECDVSVTCTENNVGGSYTYMYTITFSIKYKLANGTYTEPVVKSMTKTYKASDLHTAYLLAPVFDKTSATAVDSEGNYISTDKINITYSYTGEDERQPEFTFYLAEQPANNETVTTTKSRIGVDNVSVTYQDEVKVNLSAYDNASNKFKINTNVGKELDERVTDGSLTYSEDNVGKSLYMMTISVRYRSKDGEVLTTFTTTKEE